MPHLATRDQKWKKEPSEIDVGFNLNRFFFSRESNSTPYTIVSFFWKKGLCFVFTVAEKKQWTLIMTFGISTVNAEGLPLPQKWLNIDDKLQYFTQYAPLLPLMKGCPTSSNLIRDWFSWTKLYVCLPVSKHTSRLVQSNQSSSICNAKSH